MAKTVDEKLSELSLKLAELSKKAADASEDAKVYRELRQEAIREKINIVKGNVAAMQENIHIPCVFRRSWKNGRKTGESHLFGMTFRQQGGPIG